MSVCNCVLVFRKHRNYLRARIARHACNVICTRESAQSTATREANIRIDDRFESSAVVRAPASVRHRVRARIAYNIASICTRRDNINQLREYWPVEAIFVHANWIKIAILSDTIVGCFVLFRSVVVGSLFASIRTRTLGK